MAKQSNKQDKNRIMFISVIIAAVVVITCIVAVIVNNKKDDSKTGSTEGQEQAAGKEDASSGDGGMPAVVSGNYFADIEIKDYGTITVKLDGEAAPITVNNFVFLAKEGFYDGLTFHRIIEGFMMQGGDPEGTGMGGSDKTIIGEFANNGYDNKLSHTRGAISMARSSSYNSASSQFFIVHQDSTSLDGDYAVFGYVTEGIEVVDAVCSDAQPVDSNGFIAAEAQPVITSITIRDAN